MKVPAVSIVIISYDPTAQFLKKTFEVLSQQTFLDFEVILVDSGQEKLSGQILTSSPLIKLVPTKTISVPSVAKKDFNYAAAYNQGIQKTQGEIIIRLSADAIPADNLWLQNLITPFNFNNDGGVGIAFGKFTKVFERQAIASNINTNFNENLKPSLSQKSTKDATRQAVACKIVANKKVFIWDTIATEIKTNFNPYSIYEQIMWTLTQSNSPRTYQNFPFVAGACFGFRKEIWACHPFNENWRWGDEYEFALFALKQGFTIRYTPLSQIYHSHDLDFREGLKRIFKDVGLALKVSWLVFYSKIIRPNHTP